MRRALFLSAVLLLSGCAALAGDPPARLERQHPQEAYLTGVELYRQGELEAARLEWDRCLALAAPRTKWRLECEVALEQLPAPER